MFDRVVVISLPRRRDRLAAFRGRLAEAWPGVTCHEFAAVDGAAAEVPPGWKSTAGAWGCFLSHVAVLGQAAADGVGALLVLEDDVTFVAGFLDRLLALTIPADCEQLYLGGQHLKPPMPGPAGLVRGLNVNRTHAYAVLGRPAMDKLLGHLRWDPATWGSRHHVDHHFGRLHERGGIGVYAASPWLCGQAAGTSDVDGKQRPARAW